MPVIIAGQTVAVVVSAIVELASGHAAPDGTETGAGLLAGAGNAAGLVLFYLAAANGPLSIITPIGATGSIVPGLIGLATGDRLSGRGAAGIALAISGVMLAAGRVSASAAASADMRRTVILSVASAAWFGMFLWAISPASKAGVFWA